MATFDKVKEIIVDTMSFNEDDITMDVDLIKDLGADSIDAVELIMALEEEYGLEIPEEEAAKLTKVSEIVSYIDAHAN
ncbi:MAG: acyl carrier protein [Eubacterium sp.]|jgi:acyl carrier protein|uniref:acyl carrier protein n=1 Tax=Clostridium sp. (strain SY8519) TaxID=1042156 RepID=UPI0002171999|nr:acyl carrier protein [Clostridium sp. SY8519]BAK46330.1 acyl carrier protein [Clostridium sp. SY8519]HAD19788.1 acyl carrier protein [Lachnospiraceae bacterium]